MPSPTLKLEYVTLTNWIHVNRFTEDDFMNERGNESIIGLDMGVFAMCTLTFWIHNHRFTDGNVMKERENRSAINLSSQTCNVNTYRLDSCKQIHSRECHEEKMKVGHYIIYSHQQLGYSLFCVCCDHLLTGCK